MHLQNASSSKEKHKTVITKSFLTSWVLFLECSSFWRYLPAANLVPEFFSHNIQSSHPELSYLDSLSSWANKSLGMLSEAGGRSLLSWLRCLLTLTLLFTVSHNKGGWRMRHKAQIGYSQSVTDHSRMYYTLLPKHDQKATGLKFVWVCVQIGQLSCKVGVCVRGTPSMK